MRIQLSYPQYGIANLHALKIFSYRSYKNSVNLHLEKQVLVSRVLKDYTTLCTKAFAGKALQKLNCQCNTATFASLKENIQMHTHTGIQEEDYYHTFPKVVLNLWPE